MVVVSGFLGYLVCSYQTRPEVGTLRQSPPPLIIEVPVPVEVIKEVEIEVVKEVPVKLRHFSSVAELKDWLQQVEPEIPLIANPEGIFNLQGYCEDAAMYLQDEAMEAGYKMNVEVLGRDQYQRWYGEPPDEGELHAVNSAIIGNEFWFVDFLKDKVWLAAYLDDPGVK